jgi:NADH-quinone oxidoreductase subunit J
MYILNIINNPNLIFLILTFLIVICASFVIISKNPIHSLLFLVLIFILSTIIFLILDVEFIAMLFLVLYIGAIIVLFLFVVMMLNVRILELNERIISYIPISIIIILIFFILILTILRLNFIIEKSLLENNILYITDFFFNELIFFNYKNMEYILFQNFINKSNLNLIGFVLYTEYIYIFFLCGIVLLIAMIGSIILTLQNITISKRQDYYFQTSQNVLKSIRYIK